MTAPRAHPRASALALSFEQERLWALTQLSGNNPAYHIASAIRLFGREVIPAQLALNGALASVSQATMERMLEELHDGARALTRVEGLAGHGLAAERRTAGTDAAGDADRVGPSRSEEG